MSLDDFAYDPAKYEQVKQVISLRQNEKRQPPQPAKREESEQMKDQGKPTKPKKKKVKKQQQNQGIRIANERKLAYIFRNICNPNGSISIESLGKALVKYKIEFKLSQLQQMMALVKPDQLTEDSMSFENSQINEHIRDIAINFEDFKKFYGDNF